VRGLPYTDFNVIIARGKIIIFLHYVLDSFPNDDKVIKNVSINQTISSIGLDCEACHMSPLTLMSLDLLTIEAAAMQQSNVFGEKLFTFFAHFTSNFLKELFILAQYIIIIIICIFKKSGDPFRGGAALSVLGSSVRIYAPPHSSL
jgi:hypothetical protein